MKPITLYTANCRENKFNTRYPEKHTVTTPDDLKEAVRFDQVFAEYRECHRAIEDFFCSDCLPFDCDNDHSEDADEWKDPPDVEAAFPGVPFYVIYSRHHMKRKGKYSPRPRFHVVFPIEPTTDSAFYRQLKDSVIEFFPYFDTKAKDAARFFFGVKDPVVEYHGGADDESE
jgi:putative DNA primase/helicase